MRKIETLRRDARRLAERRGHNLAVFIYEGTGGAARCRTCTQWATIEARPAPDQPALAGAALSVNCSIGAWRPSFDVLGNRWCATRTGNGLPHVQYAETRGELVELINEAED